MPNDPIFSSAQAFDPVWEAVRRAVAVAEFDLRGNLLTANGPFLAMFGYELGDIVGAPHATFTGSSEDPKLWKRLVGGEAVTLGCDRMTKDGSSARVQAIYAPVLDEDGRPCRIALIATRLETPKPPKPTPGDIEWIAEPLPMAAAPVAAVSGEDGDKARLYDAVVSSHAVITCTPDGEILSANRVFLDLMGYAEDEIIGQKHALFVERGEADSAADHAFWSALRAGEHQAGEFRRLRKDGSEAWLEAAYAPVLDAEGSVRKIVKIATDITEKRGRRERARRALEQALDAVVMIDDEDRITYCNAAAEKLWGYEASEVIGQNVKMLAPAEFHARPDDMVDANRRIGLDKIVGANRDLKLPRRDGSLVWVNLSLSKTQIGDEITYTAFVKDIAAQKAVQLAQAGLATAIDASQAMIEFTPEGEILAANAIFLNAVGYSMAQIRGKHHSLFCEEKMVASPEYKAHWATLQNGQPVSGRFKRVTKAGETLWLQASYSPVLDEDGRVVKVVKLATDITEQQSRNRDFEGKLNAISRALASIEFDVSGRILAANKNFLRTMGYSLDEILGQHHKIFCTESTVRSKEYAEMWHNLARGEFYSGRYRRIGKHGREIWLQASYNPIFDAENKIVRVVKFATDITEQVQLENSVRDQANAMTRSVASLTDRIEHIADGAQEADALARQTENEATAGRRAVAQSLEAMTEIQKSAEGVNEILETIAEIAHQTNMLAINAAIEAARAGKHGFGFSVVADEVRKIAEKSSCAAKNITRLIRAAVQQIGKGSEVNQSANDAFRRIMRGVEETTRSISGIKQATGGQIEEAHKVRDAIEALSRAVNRGQLAGGKTVAAAALAAE